jgi:hypothetical protein
MGKHFSLKTVARAVGTAATIMRSSAYRSEGDHTMYTQTNLQKRELLQQHPTIIAAIDKFWNVLDVVSAPLRYPPS